MSLIIHDLVQKHANDGVRPPRVVNLGLLCLMLELHFAAAERNQGSFTKPDAT